MPTEDPNPYQPPAAPSRMGIIDRIRCWFRRRMRGGLQAVHHEGVIIDGIQFRVDPSDRRHLLADSPSSVAGESRMDLVEREALKGLRELAEQVADPREVLVRRRLMVRLCAGYDEPFDTAAMTRELAEDVERLVTEMPHSS